MPLTKEFTFDTGAVATYHEVSDLHVDFKAKSASCTILSYCDKAACDNGLTPMMRSGKDVSSLVNFSEKEKKLPTTEQIETHLKNTPSAESPQNIKHLDLYGASDA